MESRLKCILNNPCYLACSSKGCQSQPFVCKQVDCQCLQRHVYCTESTKWADLVQQFYEKIKQTSHHNKKIINKIESFYVRSIQALMTSLIQLKLKRKVIQFDLGREAYTFYQIVNKGYYQKLKGNLLYEAKQSLNISKNLLNDEKVDCILRQSTEAVKQIINECENSITQFKIQQIKVSEINQVSENLYQEKQIDIISESFTKSYPIVEIEQIESIVTFTPSPDLDSHITNDYKLLVEFLQHQKGLFGLFPKRKVKKITLLYRASEDNFCIQKFHSKCDYIQNTLTLVYTEFKKIIGGFTNLKWDKNKTGFVFDDSKQTFLFSITERNRIEQTDCRYTIYNDKNNGPTFGGGKDLAILNKANQNRNSKAKIGHTFKNLEYRPEKQASYTRFSGQQKGYNFKILQWETFYVQFK